MCIAWIFQDMAPVFLDSGEPNVWVCFHADYFVPLPEGHRFPRGKFAGMHRILLNEGLIQTEEVITPDEALWDDLQLVHTKAYLDSLRYGTMDRKAERRMGLPRTDGIVRRSRLATQGTFEAGRVAFEDGIAANLAGWKYSSSGKSMVILIAFC